MRLRRRGGPWCLLLCFAIPAIVGALETTQSGSTEVNVKTSDSAPSSSSILSKSSTSSFSESGILETTNNDEDESVAVESTANSAGEVQTNKPKIKDIRDSGLKSSSALKESETEAASISESRVINTVSPTLSAESLLSDELVSESINLSEVVIPDVSDEVVTSSQQTSVTSSSSSSSPSIIVSVPSVSSSMSSISVSSILPSAPTTSAPEEIVTTNPLPDEEMELYQVETLSFKPGDIRAGSPKTVKISPSTSSSRMEMTTPVYHRANPNRVGLLDGEVEDDQDHFLSHKAPQIAGGPLKNQGRSSTDGLEKNNRRAEPGPDISDILSGLLNVVGEGLSIATNYVQENNKKKLQEKLSTEYDDLDKKPNTSGEVDVNVDDEIKRNITRINNRGPPLLSNIPFEAIPLEILNNQRPGARPGVAIPQRPFQTHLPPGISGPPPTITSPSKGVAPYKSGVPLPEQLIPTLATIDGGSDDDKDDTSRESDNVVLPTRPGYSPDFGTDFESAESEQGQDNLVDRVDNKLASSSRPSTNKVTQPPPIKPVSTDPFIDLLLNEIKEGRITTPPPYKSPSTSTTPTPPLDLQPSFTPPLLVTPPSTPRNRPRPPQRRPWAGGRPPRPNGPPPPPVKKYPDWKYQNKPPSSYPTPPLKTKPFVFPSSSRRYPGGGAIVTGVAIPADNDVFDLTVTAQQNFGGSRKTKNKFRDIITQARPGDQFVSIDGKRTYFDVGPTEAPAPYNSRPSRPTPAGKGSVLGATKYLGGQEVFQPTKSTKYGQIVGSPLPVEKVDLDRDVKPQPYVPIAKRKPGGTATAVSTVTDKRPVPTTRLPPAPPVRIDTCIVGNDKTCGKHEVCRTYLGVSSCFCKPGYGRKNHRMLCKKTVRLLMSMKIDRIKDDKISWSEMYGDQNTAQYHTLEDEVNYAIGSAMALTSFSNIYMGTKVNKFFSLNGAVTVNTTLEMEENAYTRSEIVKRDIKNKLIEVIQARANNIGSGNLYVSGPFNPIPGVEDFNECSEPEYNDCGDYSVCVNLFGGFTCQCLDGYGDKFKNDPQLSGRHCESCPAEYCSNKGVCAIDEGSRTCTCTGNFYGDQCQIDGEVLAVAIGASVAAVIIIFLTLVCLCMWSRRWKREQQKTDLSRNYPRSYMVGTLPPPGYVTKMANWQAQGPGQAQAGAIYSVDNQLRWAHHLDANGQNIYAQPEPSRRGLAVGGGRMGPLPSIPRPSTALGTPRVTQAPLIDSSESEDTEHSGDRYRRPRSSSSILAASNLTLDTEEVYDAEYLRYGGTVGVRNPRLVAQMRGVPVNQQQQHIQMNMMGRGW